MKYTTIILIIITCIEMIPTGYVLFYNITDQQLINVAVISGLFAMLTAAFFFLRTAATITFEVSSNG